MTVRKATAEDIPSLVEMGAKFHAMSPHRFMGEYDPAGIANLLDFMIANAILLTNDEGIIGGILAPVYFAPTRLMAEESFLWAHKGGFELLAAFEEEARRRGASFVLMSTLENGKVQAMDRVMTRSGYQAVERRYIKELV